MQDRFGALPVKAERLLEVSRVRMLARAADIARIDAGPAAIALSPRKKVAAPPIPGLEPSNDRLLLKEPIADPDQRLDRTRALLEDILAAE